jgi:hypothetical protein
MTGRNQFTFYRSFWEAVRGLERKDQLPVLSAVIEYALDSKEPQGLTKTQTAFFLLTKPTLDASRRRAESGKQGGSKKKQTEASEKQTASKKERENKKENEIEREGEKEKKHPLSDELFSLFWDKYPAHCRGDREEAQADWEALDLDEQGMRDLIRKLDAWKASKRWTDDGGSYVPNISNFLDRKRSYLHGAPSPNGSNAVRKLDEDEREAVYRMMGENDG